MRAADLRGVVERYYAAHGARELTADELSTFEPPGVGQSLSITVNAAHSRLCYDGARADHIGSIVVAFPADPCDSVVVRLHTRDPGGGWADHLLRAETPAKLWFAICDTMGKLTVLQTADDVARFARSRLRDAAVALATARNRIERIPGGRDAAARAVATACGALVEEHVLRDARGAAMCELVARPGGGGEKGF